MKTQDAARRAMGPRSMSLTSAPPRFSAPFFPSDRPSRLPLPLMYLNAVSCGASQPRKQSINTGNTIHLWNITPSLTVSAHHRGHPPHTADKASKTTPGRPSHDRASSDTTTDVAFAAWIAGYRQRVWIGLALAKYEPEFRMIPGVRDNRQTEGAWELVFSPHILWNLKQLSALCWYLLPVGWLIPQSYPLPRRTIVSLQHGNKSST